MSDTDSRTGHRAAAERSRKRRRVEQSYDRTSGYSSPDELAASSDHERINMRGASRVGTRDAQDPRQRSFDDSDTEESPDELAIHTVNRAWRARSRTDSTTTSVLDEPIRTPIPASPPPLPEKPPMHYKPRLVLKGHKKGVAAVKISPDGQYIASCCT